MREKYHTEALILRVSDFKEANKLYHIFSEKFGLIVASAQGVRFTKSKLRFGLQEYSLSDISVVRTGDIWKITNSVPKKNYYFDFKGEKTKLDTLARINQFIQRFVHGEEESDSLYKDLLHTFELVREERGEIRDVELTFLIRFLNRLGILKDSETFLGVTSEEEMKDAVEVLSDIRELAASVLNESLRESQL